MPGPVALIWDLIAVDGASATFARVGVAAESGAAKVGKFVGALGAIALVDAGYHAVKMAGEFEQATNVLVTAAGETTANLDLIRKGILNIAETTGTEWQQVTDAMYTLEKAGYRGADALKVEMAAAQGAREENANLATVTNAMTSIMASYHLSVNDSVSVMNQLKTAAGESKTTMELFSGSLSTVLPVASANKISFADVAGSLATLTQHGTSADEATQELSNTIRNLSAPNAVAVKQMAQLGISSVDVAQKLGDGPGGRGLAGTLDYLSQTVLQKMGPAGTVLLGTFNQSKTAAAAAQTEFNALPAAAKKVAQSFLDGSVTYTQYKIAVNSLPPELRNLALQWATTQNNADGFQQVLKNGLSQNETYTQAIKAMTGGANGLNTTLQVTGESMEGTNARIKAVADAAAGAGTNVSGWDSTQKLFNVQMDKFKQSAEAAGIEIGTKLIPVLGTAAGWAATHTKLILELVGAFLAYKLAVIALNVVQALWAAGSAVVTGAMWLMEKAISSSQLSLFAFTQSARAAAVAEAGLADESVIAGAAVDTAFGPVGLVIGGIAAVMGLAVGGFELFGGSAKKQIGPVQALTDAIKQDGLAVGDLTTAQINNTLAQDGSYASGRKLGISSDLILKATLGNVDAQKQVAAAVKGADDAYAKAADGLKRGQTLVGSSTEAMKKAADDLASKMGEETGALNASVQAAKDADAALKDLAAQTNTTGGHVHDLFNDLTTLATVKIPSKLAAFNPSTGESANATGNDNFAGGVTWAGENGPERIWLPKGSKIDSAQNSKTLPTDHPTSLTIINNNYIQPGQDVASFAAVVSRNTARSMK